MLVMCLSNYTYCLVSFFLTAYVTPIDQPNDADVGETQEMSTSSGDEAFCSANFSSVSPNTHPPAAAISLGDAPSTQGTRVAA